MRADTRARAGFDSGPTVLSAGVSIGAGTVAMWVLMEAPVQRRLLGVALLGTVLWTIGAGSWKRNRVAPGVLVSCIGLLIVAVAVSNAATTPDRIVDRLVLIPGLVGIWVVSLGLIPVRLRWSRRFVDFGTALLFLAVLTAGFVQGPSALTLVIATAATILAWDAAENAVSLGGQVGAGWTTSSARAEVVHITLSTCVAGLVIVAGVVVTRLAVQGLSLGVLLALLVAGVALTLAHHR